MQAAIKEQFILKNNLASGYVQTMLRLDKSKVIITPPHIDVNSFWQWCSPLLLSIAIGRRAVLATRSDLELLLETGLVPLPPGLEDFIAAENKNPNERRLVALGDAFTLNALESQLDFGKVLHE